MSKGAGFVPQEPAGRWHLSTWRDRVMASDMQAMASPSHCLRLELDFFIQIIFKASCLHREAQLGTEFVQV